jgi:hypothetical protein
VLLFSANPLVSLLTFELNCTYQNRRVELSLRLACLLQQDDIPLHTTFIQDETPPLAAGLSPSTPRGIGLLKPR